MDILFDNVISNKVSDIIKRAHEIDGLIVCQSNSIAEEMYRVSKDIGVDIREPVSLQWFNSYRQEIVSNQTPVIVYNSEQILRYLVENKAFIKPSTSSNVRRVYTRK